MTRSTALVLCICALTSLALASEVGSRGFNDNIEWFPLEKGLQHAKTTGKPAMVLIHKSWCGKVSVCENNDLTILYFLGACKRLKAEFQNKDLEELSRKFVMINLEDSEEPQGDEFKPVRITSHYITAGI